jgi:maltose alpha-D-glucosyltransferase/alpha-amylase
MLNFTRALLKLRREHPALANSADFEPLYAAKNGYPFVYLRRTGKESIIVSINPAGKSCAVELKEVISATPLFVRGAEFRNTRLEMDPVSFGIFAVER